MKIHHIGYAVKDIESAIDEFAKIGYEKCGSTVIDEERNILIQFMRLGNYCVELVAPKDESSSINNIIKKNGSSPYHICYSVENLSLAIEDFSKNGYVLMGEPKAAVAIDCKKVVFLYNKHLGIIELVEGK